jgi:hypothetical protein
MTKMLIATAVAAISLLTANSAEARDRHDHRSDRYSDSRHHRQHDHGRYFVVRSYVDPHHSYAAPRYDRYGNRVDTHGHRVDRYGNHIRNSHHHHCD